MVKKANTSASSTGADKNTKTAPKTGGWGSKPKPTTQSAPAKAMKESAAEADKALKESISSVEAKSGPKSVIETIKAAQEAGNYPDDAQTGLESAIANAENEGMAATVPAEPADAKKDSSGTTPAEGSDDQAPASPQRDGFPASAIEQAPSPMEDAKKAQAQAAADRATAEAQKPRPNAADQQLISYCERIERLEEEKQAIAGDIKEVYAEMKSSGFDSGVFRVALRRRKMDPQAREEQDSILELYEGVLDKAARK